jgi:hypothetical protein
MIDVERVFGSLEERQTRLDFPGLVFIGFQEGIAGSVQI